jgi:hypothetical protein
LRERSGRILPVSFIVDASVRAYVFLDDVERSVIASV